MRKMHDHLPGRKGRTEYITGAPRTILKRINPFLEGSLGWRHPVPKVNPPKEDVRYVLLQLKGKATVLIAPVINHTDENPKPEVGWQISVISDRDNLHGVKFTPLHKTRTLEYGYMDGKDVRRSIINSDTVLEANSIIDGCVIGSGSEVTSSKLMRVEVGNGSVIKDSSLKSLDTYGRRIVSVGADVFDSEFTGGATLVSETPYYARDYQSIRIVDTVVQGGHLKVHNPTDGLLWIRPESWLDGSFSRPIYRAGIFTGEDYTFLLPKNTAESTLVATRLLAERNVWSSSTLCIDDKGHTGNLNACRCLMWYPLYLKDDPFAIEYIRRAQGKPADAQNPLTSITVRMLEEQMVMAVTSAETRD